MTQVWDEREASDILGLANTEGMSVGLWLADPISFPTIWQRLRENESSLNSAQLTRRVGWEQEGKGVTLGEHGFLTGLDSNPGTGPWLCVLR